MQSSQSTTFPPKDARRSPIFDRSKLKIEGQQQTPSLRSRWLGKASCLYCRKLKKSKSIPYHCESCDKNRPKKEGRHKQVSPIAETLITVACLACHRHFLPSRFDAHANKCELLRKRLSGPASYGATAKKESGLPSIRRLKCPKCEKELSPIAMDVHRCNPRLGSFPFVILPVGASSDLRDFERSYMSNGRGRSNVLDWGRISALSRLDPSVTHYGIGGWAGYGVFTFGYSSLVVLETPEKGNAMYILDYDWRQLISLSKAEIRKEFRGKYMKIVHRGPDWIRHVSNALQLGRISRRG